MKNTVKKSLRKNTRGVSVLEYAMLAVIGVIAVAGTYKTLGAKMGDSASRAAEKLQ